MEILLEFSREELSNAKDKLLQDIKSIQDGKNLKMGEIQTKWMNAIGECSDLIQKGRNCQLNGSLTPEEKILLKRLEEEWKVIYPICKKYESLLPLYNRRFPEHKLLTFKERTGKVLIESKRSCFNY